MKKRISLMLGIAAMLASCSQNEELFTDNGNNTAQQVTFTLATDGHPQTRATLDGLRYVVAVYDETGTTEVEPETTFNSNSFSIMLPPGTYTCLFWADYGDANYDATDLKNVTDKQNNATGANAEAFFASQSVTVSDGNVVNVTLNRAIAKVTLRETDVLEAGNMTVTYSRPLNFNVSDGTATGAVADTKTFTIESTIQGTIASPMDIGSFYVLTSANEANLDDFIAKYNDEAERKIGNVPVQANYQTYVTGKYGSSVSQQFFIDVNPDWNTTNKESSLLKVGSDYTLTNESGSYDCVVLSSTFTSAVVGCKTIQTITDTKDQAIAAATTKGGRLVTFAEFKQMCDLDAVTNYDNLWCVDHDFCFYLTNSGAQYSDNAKNARGLKYYIVFDISKL